MLLRELRKADSVEADIVMLDMGKVVRTLVIEVDKVAECYEMDCATSDICYRSP